MMYGRQPFVVDDESGELALKLAPALPAWLFDDDAKVSFTFLGHVTVTYHNYARVDTWEATISSHTLTFADGSTMSVGGEQIGAPYAEAVRSLTAVTAIDVVLTA